MKKLILLISVVLLSTSIHAQDYGMTSPEQLFIYQLINRPTPSNFAYVSGKTELLGLNLEGYLYDLNKNSNGIYTSGKIKQVIDTIGTFDYTFTSTTSSFGTGNKVTTQGKLFGSNYFEINYLISDNKVDSIVLYDYDDNKKILSERIFLKYDGSILNTYENITYENDTIEDWTVREFIIENQKYTSDTLYDVDKVSKLKELTEANKYTYGASQDTVSSFQPDELILPIPLPSTTRIITKNNNNEIVKSIATFDFLFITGTLENVEFSTTPLSAEDTQYGSDFLISESSITYNGTQKLNNFNIISTLGLTVSEGQFQNNQVNIESLGSGVYILKTSEGKSVKFLKR